LILELGVRGVEGHEKVEIEEEEVLERHGEEHVGEDLRDDEWKDSQEEQDGDDWLSFYEAPQLYGASWKFGSGWNRMRIFFDDLADYEVEKKGLRKEEFWRKMKDWEFHGKVIEKNGSYIHLNRFSWSEAV